MEKGDPMAYYGLLFLLMQPSGLSTMLLVNRVEPIRRPWLYALLGVTILDGFWILRHVLPEPPMMMEVVGYPLLLGLVWFFARPGHRVRTCAVQCLMLLTPLAVVYAATVAVVWICWAAGIPQAYFMAEEGGGYLLMVLLVGAATILAQWGLSEVLGRLLSPIREKRWMLWFFAIPVSQLVLINLVLRLAVESRARPLGGLTLGILLTVGADAACILAYRKLHRMQELQSQVREAEHQLSLQNAYYRDLQSRILKVNQIRHDLNNQLSAAYRLLDGGHTGEVREQLDLLRDSIRQRVGSRYCENLMVDAVLREKAEICREKGIALELSVFVPADITIESAHLCSAFLNLLDNSIQAVADPGAGPIRLESDIRGVYLVISCSNPARSVIRQESRDLLREHGLGLGILERIAREHGGSFSTRLAEGRFRADLVLRR